MDDKVLKKLRSVKASDNQCSTLILSDDHAHFAIGYGTGAVSLYETENLSHIRTENRHMLPVTDIAFTRNKLISSGADFYVIIDNIKKGPSALDYITVLVPIVAIGICLIKMSYAGLFENIERFFKIPFLR